MPDSIPSTSNGGMILTCASFFLKKNTPWILDSGATRHICSNIKLFQSITNDVPTRLVLPNNEFLMVNKSGTIAISKDIILEKVLFVPNFKFNIMSVSCLAYENKFHVKFYADSFCIQEIHHKKVIGRGKTCNGLYVLDVWNNTAHISSVSVDVWHSRLGHPSKRRLALLCNKLHCNIDNVHKDLPYYVCPMAKQKKLPFSKHITFANNKFDLIHCDTWGPINKKHSSHYALRPETNRKVSLIKKCTSNIQEMLVFSLGYSILLRCFNACKLMQNTMSSK